MSFGWSAGDVVAGVKLFVKIGKALKDSGGSKSEYQDAVKFLESVSSIITGLQQIRDSNPELEWGEGLVAQSNLVMSVIKAFKEKTNIDKYEKSLGASSQRSKAQTIGREIQFELSSVRRLQSDISPPLVVLSNFLGLQTMTSIIDTMKAANLTRDDLITLAHELSQYLPALASGVDTLNRDITAQLGGITERQQQAETNIRDDLKTLQMQMTRIQNTQVLIDMASQSSIMTQRQQRIQLQNIVQSVQSFSRTQQEVLQRTEAEAMQQLVNTQGREASASVALRTIRQLVGNGIAGAIGGMVTLLASGAGNSQKHSTEVCENSANKHEAHFEDAGNNKGGGTIPTRVNEAKGAGKLAHSDKHTTTERGTTSEPFVGHKKSSQNMPTDQGITLSGRFPRTARFMTTAQSSSDGVCLANVKEEPSFQSQSNNLHKAMNYKQSDSGPTRIKRTTSARHSTNRKLKDEWGEAIASHRHDKHKNSGAASMNLPAAIGSLVGTGMEIRQQDTKEIGTEVIKEV